VSNISGYGLYWDAYRSDRSVLRPTGFFYLFQSNRFGTEQRNLNYEVGMEAQHHLIHRAERSLFLMAGAYYYFDDDARGDDSDAWRKILHSFSTGFGIGLEKKRNRLLLSFHLGIKAFWDRATITAAGSEPTKERIWHLKEGGGFSIGFVL
jgi:hypothetical protein